MIKSLKVRNYLGDEIEITLTEDEPNHGLLLESISGLGPVKADINMTDLVTSDGSHYTSSRIGKRNIVLKFILYGDIENARHITYKYFPIKNYVDLIIKTDYREIMTSGYVESNEPDIFSEKETTSISIVCPDPLFYSQANISETATSVIKKFEFPFSASEATYFTHAEIQDYLDDNILDSDSDVILDSVMKNTQNIGAIEFGECIAEPSINIENEGNVEVGITITLKFFGECGNVAIYNDGSDQRMAIYLSRIPFVEGINIINGDRMDICTITGRKSATLSHDGKKYNVFYCLEDDPDWIRLVGGTNIFTYSAEYNKENVELTIKSADAYEGI